jgi:hypothetical protein
VYVREREREREKERERSATAVSVECQQYELASFIDGKHGRALRRLQVFKLCKRLLKTGFS